MLLLQTLHMPGTFTCLIFKYLFPLSLSECSISAELYIKPKPKIGESGMVIACRDVWLPLFFSALDDLLLCSTERKHTCTLSVD